MTLDLTKYKLGVDVWEGDDDPDWKILYNNGVSFAILRMNNSWGGLGLDRQIHNYPIAVESGLKCGVYAVISPNQGISRFSYVTWLKNNIPSGCKVVCLDIEIEGSTAAVYSSLVTGIATDLKAEGFIVIIYSGSWFWQYLNPWPTMFDQWWARYLSFLQPHPPIHITWDQLRVKLATLDGYYPLGSYEARPGHVAIWQCSSANILPGGPVNFPIDINLMPVDDFNRIFGGIVSPPVPTLEQRVTALEDWVKLHG
jgi:hypothetical protein